MGPLLVFDTHPIQYRSPVFRDLFEKLPGMKVYYFDSTFDAKRWWFSEVGKTPKQQWEIPLLDGFPSEVIGTRDVGVRDRFKALKEILDREHPEAVAIYGYYLLEHWMLRWLCARRRIAMIFIGETFQNGRPSLRRLIKQVLRRWFFRSIDKFIAIGTKTMRYYRDLGIAPGRLVSAKYCVDRTFFQLPRPEAAHVRSEWRAALGIPSDAFVLLFVGRLFERKRPEDVFRIHQALSEDQRMFTVLVGNGPMETELRAQSQLLPRSHCIGFQNQGETRSAYYGADALIVPSEFETWGLVINEAACCGLPAVVTDTCGAADDLVVHGETGFVYPVGALSKAAALVGSLKDDGVLRHRLASNARSRVERDFDVSQFADAFLKALPTSA